MKIIRLLTLFVLFSAFNARYPLHHSDDRLGSYPTFDCLYAYLPDDTASSYELFIRNYHLIPYCRRPDIDERQDELIDELNKNVENMIPFAELKKQGVTSEQLITWSATVDAAERYENDSGSSLEVFYNCSPRWFGPKCQYKFEFDTSSLSFGTVVRSIFTSRLDPRINETIITCYPFLLNCSRVLSFLCLDWREICDGKVHCFGGEDEQMCEELELNECADDEYRCHFGGQCIPLAFVLDSRTSMDCLDGTEESEKSAYLAKSTPLQRSPCVKTPTFRCEERTCRSANSFSCGDGECFSNTMLLAYDEGCSSHRNKAMTDAMLNSLDLILNINCQQAVSCLLRRSLIIENECNLVFEYFRNISSDELLDAHCSSKWFVLPVKPIIYDYLQFIYLTNRSFTEFMEMVVPDLICFDPQICPALLSYTIQTEMDTEFACVRSSDMIPTSIVDSFQFWWHLRVNVAERCVTVGTELSCSHSSLFHCARSTKCMSYHRVVDGFNDCYYGEDESYPACQLNDSQRFVCGSEPDKCLSPIAIGNGKHDCIGGEDEMTLHEQINLKRPLYSSLCNGEKQIHGQNETDETHCESWPCDNAYSQCNVEWNCWNGADEFNCPDGKCLFNEHKCGDRCLPVTHLFEKYLDDCNDPYFNRELYFDNETNTNLTEYISWNNSRCLTKDLLCKNHSLAPVADNETCSFDSDIVGGHLSTEVKRMKTGETLCRIVVMDSIYRAIPFQTTSRLGFFPPRSSNDSVQNITINHQNIASMTTFNISQHWYCNRGIPVLFGLNETRKCLCPPSYFGDQCQWQNQRVSLTLQIAFRSAISSSLVFQLVVMLVDEQGQIKNHEQITYVPARDCNTKFNIYLLYPDRPKNQSANHSVHIDVFDKMTLAYYVSWHLAIPFQFLPVNRLAHRLFISGLQKVEHCPLSCGNHGRCVWYANKKSLYFCQCDRGYWGSLCDVTHECHCSIDSLCLASSICVCPLHKFGPRCYMKQSICQSSKNPCEHNGLCIPTDARIHLQEFTCLCTEGYSGTRCEITTNRVDIKIHETFSTVFVHFVTIFKDKVHERTTTLKKILYDQHMMTLYVTQPFHIVFVELPNEDLYLTVVRETFLRSEHIIAEVLSNQRCSSINQLMNTTLLSYPHLRRVKYYPLLCRQYSKVMCFYDEFYMCLCDLDRFANCFEFNRSMSYDCQGYNDCQNGGRCFPNNASCPSVTMCVCRDCYYGAKCQFSTKGFVLSLDPILGYHIKPNVSFARQPSVIKVSIAVVMLLLVVGLINGTLSIITFHSKAPKEFGCGIYLLVSSSISICTMSVLTIKFLQLLLFQMTVITNRSFLNVNCVITDVIIKVLFTSGEWLNACVAAERMLIVIKGVNFNKRRSKRMAQRVILIVILVTALTSLHDPIYRHLIDDFDADEQRTWCFVQYPPSLEIFNSFMTSFHFLAPLSINFISAVVIIISAARTRANANSKTSFKQNLRLQLHEHKHLLAAPCVLIVLGLPRLIITFFSGCMKTAREPWLFLVGYFISFIPTTLMFAIFVLPSDKYKKEFRLNFRKTIRQLHLTT